ncbi:8-amino-7-oxononanoate synthase [Saccharopolyspora erythraea NRRL 2338]|uniref:8-amino-7-oxononanoate synthase n=2 Tax=Saccharopolyspora erythraea TaxID=1836 RepID=A4F8D4_SACEN|nr:8-amino-7-oxononanoate synthase [Saccharopolyspora erythraea]EQD85338.1 8-amino-7-oxononanoate synthase [Saccharopolyspora erythraea D]PFG94104.1 8-amino-7-oxononanoate synthase [Saccharopolyspora erythraea NRRL 2338]QRK90895.1 8-amino-7-oxononanoate synthase [Saccharopolyspora erythraea]CAM00309.1 8-amino-7-oxononanoate synthase [Saccharopolyspora erythraea NRRL 2338]
MPPISRESAFAWIDRGLDERDRAGLTRTLLPRDSADSLLDLAGNDYLGLSRHPAVIGAAAEAAARWGAGSTGSRLVTGTTELHHELEEELAATYGTEAALVFSSGYAANLAVLTALTEPDSLIVSDQHNHASLVDGCRLSRARTEVFPHADVWRADGLLRAHDGPALVVTESVFSVDGDVAALRELHDVVGAHGAALFVDDAHGFGIIGPGGAGAFSEAGLVTPPDAVATATLSEALGTQGGAVLGPRRVIRHLTQTARTFVFDAGLAPACAGAALAALRVLSREPGRGKRVRLVAEQLHEGLINAGLVVNPPGAAVLSLPAGSPSNAVEWAAACRAGGVAVGCFRPPAVPDSTSRLRLTARADLTEQQIAQAVRVIADAAPHHLRL